MEIVRKCAICSAASTLHCTECLITYYCSASHQAEHWSVHELQCSARNLKKIISEEDSAICYYVAKRDFQKGQILFMDHSLIVYPFLAELQRQPSRLLKIQPHICLGCCKRVATRNLCSKCKWPVCNEICEKELLHSQMECPILANNGVLYNDAFMLLYVWIALLRTLCLRDISPSRWNNLCNLPGYTATKKTKTKTLEHNRRVMSFIRKKCKISHDDFDEETTTKILEIIYTNTQVKGTCGRIENKSMQIPRSCVSNVGVLNTKTNEDFKYFATENIEKGEKLYIHHQFDSSKFILGSQDRQNMLLRNEQIICKCKLCLDPSEAQSFISAITCECSGTTNQDYPNESYHVLLPVNALDHTTVWQCNACQKLESGESISDLVTQTMDESHTFMIEYTNEIQFLIISIFTPRIDGQEIDFSTLHNILGSFNSYLQLSETMDHEESTRVHPHHSIVCEEKLTFIRARYAFLVLNRHPIYSPKTIFWKKVTFQIPPREPFDGLSFQYRQVSEQLYEMSNDLLLIVRNFSASVSLPCVILNYMLAFSKWMIIIDDVKRYQNYEDFHEDIIEWCVLKDKADLLLVLDEGEYPGKQRWCGCADWLIMMNSVNVTKDPSINCRDLYDSLLNTSWVRR